MFGNPESFFTFPEILRLALKKPIGLIISYFDDYEGSRDAVRS